MGVKLGGRLELKLEKGRGEPRASAPRLPKKLPGRGVQQIMPAAHRTSICLCASCIDVYFIRRCVLCSMHATDGGVFKPILFRPGVTAVTTPAAQAGV